jgi:hypothetical protein
MTTHSAESREIINIVIMLLHMSCACVSLVCLIGEEPAAHLCGME